MAYRSDISVYWHLNPRIIEIAAPSTTLTIQDLYDTCKTLEQRPQNLVYAKLCDAFGNIELGENEFTVVTLILLDAKLRFEARDGPDLTQCSVGAGNLVAYNTETELFVSPIAESANTQVIIKQATTGAAIGLSASDIAAAVWNALRTAYSDADTMGESIGLIPTMNTVINTIEEKVQPIYEIQQGWVYNPVDKLFQIDCVVNKNGQFCPFCSGSTFKLTLYVAGNLVYTSAAIPVNGNGIFETTIAQNDFAPVPGKNFTSVATISEGEEACCSGSTTISFVKFS